MENKKIKEREICGFCGAKHRIENAAQMPRLADFFKLFGDSTRVSILAALDRGEMCVCELSDMLAMTKSAVSHQLGKMRNSGVVRCRREGKEVYYSLDDEHVAEIFAVTAEHISHGKGAEK